MCHMFNSGANAHKDVLEVNFSYILTSFGLHHFFIKVPHCSGFSLLLGKMALFLCWTIFLMLRLVKKLSTTGRILTVQTDKNLNSYLKPFGCDFSRSQRCCRGPKQSRPFKAFVHPFLSAPADCCMLNSRTASSLPPRNMQTNSSQQH